MTTSHGSGQYGIEVVFKGNKKIQRFFSTTETERERDFNQFNKRINQDVSIVRRIERNA